MGDLELADPSGHHLRQPRGDATSSVRNVDSDIAVIDGVFKETSPLLTSGSGDLSRVPSTSKLHESHVPVTASAVLQEAACQARLGGPVLINLVLNTSLPLISMAFVARAASAVEATAMATATAAGGSGSGAAALAAGGGDSGIGQWNAATNAIAAFALAMSLYGAFGRVLLYGLCGGLDTLATQAHGAGAQNQLPVLLQRCIAFCAAHLLPVTAALVAAPSALAALGQDAALAQEAGRYLRRALPALWIEAINRPLNRILISQGIVHPSMFVMIAVATAHFGMNYAVVSMLGWGPLGVAHVLVASQVLLLALLVAAICLLGIGRTALAPPTWEALQRWPEFARVTYPNLAMDCLESWTFQIVTVASGWLPDAHASLAAIGVANSLYSALFMGFVAGGMAVCTRVGNALGACAPGAARLSALTAAMCAPLLSAAADVVLVVPQARRAVLSAFTDGNDPQMMRHLDALLDIVAVSLFTDGWQTVMRGVITGAGKQDRGALINLGSYYGYALPLALVLAFPLGLGVEALYAGVLTGCLGQCVGYGWLTARMSWARESRVAAARAAGAAAAGGPR